MKPIAIGFKQSLYDVRRGEINAALKAFNQEARPAMDQARLPFKIGTIRALLDGQIQPRDAASANMRHVAPLLDHPALKTIRAANINPEHLNVIADGLRLTDEGVTAIQEEFMIMATTPEQVEIWNEANDLAKRMKALDKRLKPYGVHVFGSIPALFTNTLEVSPETVVLCENRGPFAGRRR